MSIAVGVQKSGYSPHYTKKMALHALDFAVGDNRLERIADIGGGRGELSIAIASRSDQVYLLDYDPPTSESMASNVTPIQADLNDRWPLADETIDFAISLEVIEHVENPRHFFRELARITKPGGHIFVTTPNCHSLSSRLTFVLRGQHRYFQDAAYPAHITALLTCDIERISNEVGMTVLKWVWSNHDTLPRLRWRLPLGGRLFSDSMGALLRNRDPA